MRNYISIGSDFGYREVKVAHLWTTDSCSIQPKGRECSLGRARYSLEMHKLEAREVIAGFRDSLLRELAARGTPEAMNAMRALAVRLPNKRYIRSLLFSSRLQSLHRTWKPPTPQQILSLVRHPRSRLVQNASHLQDVLVDSLRRWEAKLQGTPPAAFQLWEQSPHNRPKVEERLSDAVALHLKEDLEGRGVAVNREVQIRPKLKGAGKGERTDIQVDATPLGAGASVGDIVTVTIEVKGCWHNELTTATQSQLVGRYLTDTSTKHGLYLVGWFPCKAWNDPKDSRRAKTPKMEIDEIQHFLDVEATRASAGSIKVRAVVINTSLR